MPHLLYNPLPVYSLRLIRNGVKGYQGHRAWSSNFVILVGLSPNLRVRTESGQSNILARPAPTDATSGPHLSRLEGGYGQLVSLIAPAGRMLSSELSSVFNRFIRTFSNARYPCKRSLYGGGMETGTGKHGTTLRASIAACHKRTSEVYDG